MSLPTYPFNRERYWTDAPAHASASPNDEQIQAIRRVLYETGWREQVLNGDALVGSDVLLVGNHSGFCEQLSRELQKRGVHSVVRPLPKAAEAFASALRDVVEQSQGRPVHVVYLGDLDLDVKLTRETLRKTDEIVGPALLNVMQAVAADASSTPLRLWIITRGVQAVNSPQDCSRPAGAILWGLGKSFSLEHADHWGGMIDLPAHAAEQDASHVAAELASSDGEDQIAYREGKRWVARLGPLSVSLPAERTSFESRGVYWVTGGLGAIGLQTADWLVRHGARCIVLQSRRGLPDRATWETLLRCDDEIARQIAAIRKIESLGAVVHVLAADVANGAFIEKAKQFLAELRQPLRAVFHAAGVSGLKPLAEMTADEFRTVLAAKVAGLWNLHELVRDFPAAPIVCFSSIAAVWGSRSLGHYAAANQFMDAFVQYRRGQGLPGVSINWGPLQGGGMDLDREQERLGRVGIRLLPAAQMGEILGLVMNSSRPVITAADVDWSIFKPVYEAQRRRPFLEAIAIETTQADVAGQTGYRTRMLEADMPRREQLAEAFLLSQTAVVLKTREAQLDVAEPLTSLGVDSLMAMEVQKRVQVQLGVTVPVSDFLQGLSLRQLAKRIASGMNPEARACDTDSANELVGGEL